MTPIRKTVTVLLTALAVLGVLSLVSGQQQAQTEATQPALTLVVHEVDLPSPEFTAMVLGYGADAPAPVAERLGSIARDVCWQFEKGFTYMSIRSGLVWQHGISVGEAGILMSAASLYVCGRS